MKKVFFNLLGLSVFFVATLQNFAFGPPQQERLADYDKRSGAIRPSATAEQTAAAGAFQSKSAHAQVHLDKVTGAPSHVAVRDGFLSQADPKTMAKDPYSPTRKFLDTHRDLFGHG